MDPIKEAMIREDDTGERNPALDQYRERMVVHCRRCGDDITENDHEYCIGPRAGHYCFGCSPHGEFMRRVEAAAPARCNHWPGQTRCGVCGMGC